jgi:TadE-like protein
MKYFNRVAGQHLVEFVLCVPLFIIFISGVIVFVRFHVMRGNVLSAARLASELQASRLVSPEEIEAELSRALPAGFHWETGRFLKTPASKFYFLNQTHIKGSIHGWPIDEIVVVAAADN